MWILIVIAVLYVAYKLLPFFTKILQKKSEKLRAETLELKMKQEAREKARRDAIRNMELEPLRQRADRGEREYIKELANRYYMAYGGVEEKDEEQAYHYLSLLAEMEDYSLAYELGRITEDGIPGKMEPDEAKAAEIYYRGGLAGDVNSRDMFAMLTFSDRAASKYGHAEEAWKWLLERAEKDAEGTADELIAELFAAQNPVALKDPVTPEHALRESFTWMQRAANKDNAEAADILALAFTTGDFLQYRNTVTVNLEQARRCASVVWNDPMIQLLYKQRKPLPYSNFFYTLAVLNRADPEKMRMMLREGAENRSRLCIEALQELDRSKAV